MSKASTDITMDAQESRLRIGAILKEARIAKELSYDDIVKATCIRKKIIEALEEGNFSKIGSETYIIGFIKTYAGFLDLETDELLSLYAASPLTKKYIHPFDMAFPEPVSMAPTRKFISACALSLAFLFVSFTLYDQHMAEETLIADQIPAHFTAQLNEAETPLPVAESVETSETIAAAQTLTPYGDATRLKPISKIYKIFNGAEEIMLDPQEKGWIELYEHEKLLLRTELHADYRYYMNTEPDLTLVTKDGNFLQATYKGTPITLNKAETCNDHSCMFPSTR